MGCCVGRGRREDLSGMQLVSRASSHLVYVEKRSSGRMDASQMDRKGTEERRADLCPSFPPLSLLVFFFFSPSFSCSPPAQMWQVDFLSPEYYEPSLSVPAPPATETPLVPPPQGRSTTDPVSRSSPIFPSSLPLPFVPSLTTF